MPLPQTVRRLPLDASLTGFAELVGDAQVVAIGENNHHIGEFTRLRERMLRLLVTELDFSVVAFESGFPEGQLVDEWIRGGPGDLETVGRDGFTFRFGDFTEMHDMLRWLRAHNTAGGRVRFTGVDVPGSGGSGLPALHRARAYLSAHHPDDVPAADAAIEATAPYRAANNSAAVARYAELSTAQRDAATTALTRLLLRLDALPGHPGGRVEQLTARHHALGALRVDEHLRELVRLGEPDPPQLLPSSRDVYQAATVRWLREVSAPGERIVLLMHNGHVQRTPMQLVPSVWMPSAGSHLATDLGGDYLAVGLTARTGSTTAADLNDQAPQGIQVVSRPLGPPAPDSVEQAVVDSVPQPEPVLLDLRPARGAAGPASIRHADTHVPVDVPAAYDALVCLPEMSPGTLAQHPDR